MPANVAILGAGIFAKKQHVPAVLAASDLLTLTSVYSRSSASASTLVQDLSLKSVQVYADDASDGLDALLAREDIHAVIVALPILTQPELIRRCLRAGKHVLSEKPVAKDVATAKALIEEYEKSAGAAKWIIAEQFGYEEALQHAARLVKEGAIGQIRSFNLESHRFVSAENWYFNTAWRKVPEYQGGFVLDGGVHLFAALRILFGDLSSLSQTSWPPTHISAFTRLTHQRLAPVDTVHAIVTLEQKPPAKANEASASIQGCISISYAAEHDIKPPRPLVTIYGSKGTLEVDSVFGPDGVTPTWTVLTHREGKEEADKAEFESLGVANEVKAFGQAIQSGMWEVCEAKSGPRQALIDVAVVEACLRSGEQSGQPMRIDV